jgi:hypothetical protein
MVLRLNQVIFPPQEFDKAAKRFVEWIKSNPPDPSIEKSLCIGVRSTEDGNITTIGISQVVEGKVHEALERGTKQNLFLAAGIPGLKYKVDVMLDISEIYNILGMTTPVK